MDIKRLIPELFKSAGFSIGKLLPSLWLKQGASTYTDVAAQFVRANTEYLSRAYDGSFDHSGDWTYCFWICPELDATTQDFFGMYQAVGDQRSIYFRRNASNTLVIVISEDGAVNTNTLTGNGSLDTDTWTFVVVRYDSSANQIVVNLDNDSPINHTSVGDAFTSNSPFEIGVRQSGASPFEGKIDSFNRFNKYLTDADVTELYNSGNGHTYIQAAGLDVQSPSDDEKDFEQSGSFSITAGSVVNFPEVTDGSDFLFTAWMRPDGFAGDTGSATLFGQQDAVGPGGSDRCFIDTVGTISLRLGDANSIFTGSLTLLEWTHVAVNKNGNDYNLYLNGVVDATTITSASSFELDRIANGTGSDRQRFSGLMTDIKIYDESKTAVEIAAIFNGANDTTNLHAHFELNGDFTDSSGNGNNGTSGGGIGFSSSVPCNGSTPIDSDLVAWWDLDEKSGTRADSSGNGHHLTDNNTVGFNAGVPSGLAQDDGDGISEWTDSTSNGNDFSSAAITNYPALDIAGSVTSINFDGADDKLDGPIITGLDGDNAHSIVAWINPATFGESDLGNIYSQLADGIQFKLKDDSAEASFQVIFDRATTDLNVIGSSSAISTSTWQMVSYTYDGSGNASGVKLYVNDTEDTPATTTTGSGAFTASTFSVVGAKSGSTESFEGLIGEIIVTTSELTDSEIASVYNATKGSHGL